MALTVAQTKAQTVTRRPFGVSLLAFCLVLAGFVGSAWAQAQGFTQESANGTISVAVPSTHMMLPSESSMFPAEDGTVTPVTIHYALAESDVPMFMMMVMDGVAADFGPEENDLFFTSMASSFAASSGGTVDTSRNFQFLEYAGHAFEGVMPGPAGNMTYCARAYRIDSDVLALLAASEGDCLVNATATAFFDSLVIGEPSATPTETPEAVTE